MKKLTKFLAGLAVLLAVAITVKAAIDWKLDPNESNYTGNTVQMLVDVASDTVTYIGRAKSGTATSAAAWQIYRKSVSGAITSLQCYEGDASYNAVWDARASATYK